MRLNVIFIVVIIIVGSGQVADSLFTDTGRANCLYHG